MTYRFLNRLYCVCTDDTSGSPPFAEMYNYIPETKTADEAFGNRLEQLPACDRDELDHLAVVACLAYEKQGFINGFRMAMLLNQETGY